MCRRVYLSRMPLTSKLSISKENAYTPSCFLQASTNAQQHFFSIVYFSSSSSAIRFTRKEEIFEASNGNPKRLIIMQCA